MLPLPTTLVDSNKKILPTNKAIGNGITLSTKILKESSIIVTDKLSTVRFEVVRNQVLSMAFGAFRRFWAIGNDHFSCSGCALLCAISLAFISIALHGFVEWELLTKVNPTYQSVIPFLGNKRWPLIFSLSFFLIYYITSELI